MLLSYLIIMSLQISCLILPGADFFVTINNSIKYGYKHGIATAIGIGIGLFLNGFITYWFGSFLQHQEPLLFKMLISLGAFYLLYISFTLLKNVFAKSSQSSDTQTNINNLKSFGEKSIPSVFMNGFFTNLANVKVVIFFSSMLSLVSEFTTPMLMLSWVSMAVSTIVWFAIVALFFGNDKFRTPFLRNMKKVEFVSGSFILIFALVILFELFM